MFHTFITYESLWPYVGQTFNFEHRLALNWIGNLWKLLKPDFEQADGSRLVAHEYLMVHFLKDFLNSSHQHRVDILCALLFNFTSRDGSNGSIACYFSFFRCLLLLLFLLRISFCFLNLIR